jgi:hypothetical protein
MPTSKIRGKSKGTHYNPNGRVLVGKARIAKWGKRGKPIPGSTLRVKEHSKFMGTVMTPTLRREYMKKQAEGFKAQYIADVELKRSTIQEQEDKSAEEIAKEVDEFNEKQVTEAELDSLAERYSRFQINKENKQFKAWMKGESYYTYKGKTFPVITERFLKESQSIKDIVKVEGNNDEPSDK